MTKIFKVDDKDPAFILNGEVYIHAASYAVSLMEMANESKRKAEAANSATEMLAHKVSAELLIHMSESITGGLASIKKESDPNLDWLKSAVSE